MTWKDNRNAKKERRKEFRSQRAEQGTMGRVHKAELRKDIDAMQKGTLGLSPAEKRQQVMEATEAAGQSLGAADTLAARTALGGVQDTGMDPQQTAMTTAGLTSQAAQQADQYSQDLAEKRRKDIRAAVESQRNHQQDMAMQFVEIGADMAKTVLNPIGEAGGQAAAQWIDERVG